jgi:transcriptional regulator with XRE-family HTH domain
MNVIKEVLEKRNLSQKWLAKELGTTCVSVNNWCQNKSQPTIEKLFKIARVLDAKPSSLLNDYHIIEIKNK